MNSEAKRGERDWVPVAPEDAATVVLVREGTAGLEVYLTRRQDRLKFLPGFHVFPGGKVDAADSAPALIERCRGLSPEAAAERLPEPLAPARALGFFMAGARELFEEAGVLLAEDHEGRALDHPAAALCSRLDAGRQSLQARQTDFLALLVAENLFPAAHRLLWFAHWITPAFSPRRFNTYFFLAKLPAGQTPAPFAAEIREALWATPEAALDKRRHGEGKMIPPTIASLDTLARYPTWSALERDYLRLPHEHPRTVWAEL